MGTKQGSEKVNSEGNLVPIDPKVGQLLVRLFIPILQDLLPTQSLPIEDGPSSDTIFYLLGRTGIIGNSPIFFAYALVIFLKSSTNNESSN